MNLYKNVVQIPNLAIESQATNRDETRSSNRAAWAWIEEKGEENGGSSKNAYIDR
jgi:hypothetical protein